MTSKKFTKSNKPQKLHNYSKMRSKKKTRKANDDDSL